MNYFVGIDFGTSGVRAIAINLNGEILATSRTEYDIRDYKTWQSALYEVIASLPKKIRQATNKIVIDGTSATVLICDRDGKAIGASMIYSDACSQEVLEHAKKIAPPQHSVCSATSSFAKLVLFLENEGLRPSFSSLYFLHQADWLGYLLHGKLGVSDYHNALKLGYDPLLLGYPDWLKNWALQHPEVILPEVFAPSKTIGIIQEEIAAKLNLPFDCEIGAGTTDSNAAFLACVGTKNPAIGTAVTSLGSTMVLKVLSDRPINDSRYGIYSHRFEHSDFGCLWLVGGAKIRDRYLQIPMQQAIQTEAAFGAALLAKSI